MVPGFQVGAVVNVTCCLHICPSALFTQQVCKPCPRERAACLDATSPGGEVGCGGIACSRSSGTPHPLGLWVELSRQL